MSGEFNPDSFFDALRLLVSDDDIITIGTYNPCSEVYNSLSNMETSYKFTHVKPYEDSFHLNRREFPRGRAFDLRLDRQTLETLRSFCLLPQGSYDKKLFFDHLIVYRLGHPILPLLNFHDAFNGGMIYLSGHYSGDELTPFIGALKATIALKRNPDYSSGI